MFILFIYLFIYFLNSNLLVISRFQWLISAAECHVKCSLGGLQTASNPLCACS